MLAHFLVELSFGAQKQSLELSVLLTLFGYPDLIDSSALFQTELL